MQVKNNGQKVLNRYYFLQNYEIDEQNSGNVVKKLYLAGDFYTAPAVMTKSGNSNNWSLHYICRDYLGSITAITNSSGMTEEARDYDAWGRPRNTNLAVYAAGSEPSLLLGRGYTGHEHLPWFGLINMNARLYDPAVGRFLSPDPFVQAPTSTQNFNRYSYALNNPMKYTDPDGEFWWLIPAALGYYFFFTDAGYQTQKYFSQYAFRIDIKIGTHQKGIGYEYGKGDPKLWNKEAHWEEKGSTYYWKNYGGYRGWEHRTGHETTYYGLFTKGETEYTAGEFSQTVGYRKFGIPGLIGVDVYNDLWGDGGDRFRTSRVRLNALFVGLENYLFTGDRGMEENEKYARKIEKCGPYDTWIQKPNDPYAPDPDKYRHGVLSLNIGPLSIGIDSEEVRYFIQNIVVHNLTVSNYFRYKKEKRNGLHFQFGGW